MSFNITSLVRKNKAFLKWNNLPDEVQNVLLNQQGSSLLYLTFEQWNWVDTNEKSNYSAASLISILPQELASFLPQIVHLVAPVQFEMKINMKYEFKGKSITKFVKKFFKIFYNFFTLIRQKESKNIILKSILKAKLALY